ncbi:putative xyloglucan galactosyltransferase GT20 [Tasmannia lanceolata]|uniref:putative xyloglucan galactosyltransferase GT20 n=1 Tax=Tasmannia lanceolata TaxID=3420 RepID=UPI00406445BF
MHTNKRASLQLSILSELSPMYLGPPPRKEAIHGEMENFIRRAKMAITIVRKRASQGKNAVKEEVGLFHLLIRRSLSIPPIILILLLLLLLFLWCSSTLLSVSIFHVCVSSRKLNLHCLTARTHADFDKVIVWNNYNSNPQNSQFAPKAPLGHSYTNNWSIPLQNSQPAPKAPLGHSYTNNRTGNNNTNNRTGKNNNNSNNNQKEDMKEDVDYAVKVVEEQMKALRSSASGRRNPSNKTACDGTGIFVYNLPPKFNKDLLDQCHEMLPWMDFCEYFANDAIGEPIPKLGKGWYNTHQYSLEPIFHSRVLKHHCRVYNEDEAKLFYVPFYGGLDILRWHFKNVTEEVKDSLGSDLVKWLETQSSWARNSGKDHVFVLGKISWDFRRENKDTWGTHFLELNQMQNPLKLLIERKPWHINDIGIPHPTHFHPRSDKDIIQWQSKIIQSQRKNLVSFAGGARPEASESIRSVLIKQCTRSSGYCSFMDCNSGECTKPESIIELFTESEFCLQPPGDSPTRKSVFDSLVSGCIPVLFDPFTAYYQYPWHLPEDHRRYSVYIDKEEVREMKVDVVERLRKVSIKEREDMRRYIVYELMPGLVYGDLGAELHKFEDAFDISIKNLVDRVSISDS